MEQIRRIFWVEVGNLPKEQVENYFQELIKQLRKKKL
jgi:polyhydroxyalkanoate synthesis regulator phasin